MPHGSDGGGGVSTPVGGAAEPEPAAGGTPDGVVGLSPAGGVFTPDGVVCGGGGFAPDGVLGIRSGVAGGGCVAAGAAREELVGTGVVVVAGVAREELVGTGVVAGGAAGAGAGVATAGGGVGAAGATAGGGAGVATVAGGGAVVVPFARTGARAGEVVAEVAGAASAARGIVVIGCGPVSSGFFGFGAAMIGGGCGIPSPTASGARATRSGAGSSGETGGGCAGPGAVDSPSGNCSGSAGGMRGSHAATTRSAQTEAGDMPSGGCERHAA